MTKKEFMDLVNEAVSGFDEDVDEIRFNSVELVEHDPALAQLFVNLCDSIQAISKHCKNIVEAN